jgi:adenine-specific DNA-methyltransferase
LYSEVGHNQVAKAEINNLLGSGSFSTPKPEQLLQRIILLASNEGDTILDFFSGSGTTGAVAHKMNRKWIMTEQMDYIETVTKERLKKVIDGEQGGISEDVSQLYTRS